MQPPIEMLRPPVAQSEAQQTGGAASTATTPENALINSGYWPWISLALAIGWITTTVLFLSNRRPNPAPANPAAVTPILPLARAVEKACHKADARKTKEALLEWAAVRWPDDSITSLADIANISPAELSEQVIALNRALYSAHADNWDPKALCTAFQAFISQKHKAPAAQDTILEPLYKS